MKKWTENDIEYLKSNLHKSTRELAQDLDTTLPSIVKMKQKLGLKKVKKAEKQEFRGKEVAIEKPKSQNKKISEKAKKAKDIAGQIKKGKKYKELSVDKFLIKDEKFQESISELLAKIRLCLIKKSPAHLSGHSKLKYVSDNYFVSLKNSQYLFFDENKSCFIPMNIFNGIPREKGETRKLLDAWKEQYLKEKE